MSISFNHLVIDRIEFEKTLDFLPYPFVIAELTEGTYQVIYVNQKFIDEVGYICEEISTIDDWYTNVYPDSRYRQEVRSAWTEKFAEAQREGRDFVQMKVLIHTKNNGDKWYEIKSSITGNLQLAALVNIHEVVSKEKELRKVNENKNNILSILTHDLRSPIITLHSLTELALQKKLSQQEFFEIIRTLNEKSRKTLDLLDTTLLWARANFDTLIVSYKEVDLKQIVHSVLAVYESSLVDKRLSVTVEIENAPLRADPDVIMILFRNILSNAIKYTPEGGSIVIGATLRVGVFTLFVKDTGIGLSHQQLEKIRALGAFSTAGTNAERGFGIGLKLCMQLVRKIKGELTFESEPGKGTRASVVVRQ